MTTAQSNQAGADNKKELIEAFIGVSAITLFMGIVVLMMIMFQ